jgi:short-subunit dehydrogenase
MNRARRGLETREGSGMRRDLVGKRVLLTGASSGIGWYVADHLVRAGAFVLVTGRRQERLDQLRLSFGNPQKRLIAVAGDVADHQHRLALVATAVEQFGGLDILINNAGIGAFGQFEEASPERLRRVFEVDFFAATELTRLALPHLHRGRQPAICLVNSVLGHRGVPNKSEYCAAKFALRGWSESLRVELKPAGIDVVSVSPSTTRSEFFQSLVDSHGDRPASPFGAQSAATVASSVIRALRKRKRDLILSPGGKALVWLARLAPKFTDRLLLQYA